MLNSFLGFEYGTANSLIYKGQYFADNEDVIVVTAKSVYEELTISRELICWTKLSCQHLWISWSARYGSKPWPPRSTNGFRMDKE